MIWRALQALLLLCSLALPALAQAEKVVLQLKWEHEFQFAGYYAALWQGFYADEGLEVEIRPASTPDGRLVSPADELVAGRADFAIGALDILVRRDRGVPLVVLAPIFQRSPNSIFALPDVPLNNLSDLAHLRIASPMDDFTRAEVVALFSAGGIAADKVHFVDRAPTLETLFKAEADALATYGISARYAASEAGISLQELSPQDFGLDFYGDTLYTHQQVVDRSPQMVRRFLNASLRGWEYALNHKQEMARRIASELPRHLFSYRDQEGYNLAFAEVIDSYMAWPYTEIGHNNLLRWQHMVNQLQSAGVLEHDLSISRLVFDDHRRIDESHIISVLFLLLVALALLLSLYFTRRIRHAWLFYIAVLLLVGGFVRFLEIELQEDHHGALEVDVLQQLNSVASKLSGELNRNIAYVTGMAAHIASLPQIDQQAFGNYAQAIFSDEPLIRSLAAAPDMVVSMVYPLEANRSVLGLDYRQNTEQRAVAMRARDSLRPALAGPLQLVQGGIAFIVRTGVHATDARGQRYFWGILSAPLMADDLYDAAGLLSPDLALNIAIRGQDGKGASGEVFFGDPALFDDPDALKTTILVGDGSWQLVAGPRTGWAYQGINILLVRLSACLLVVALFLLLIWRQRQLQVRTEVQARLRENEGLLREVSRVALINGWRIPPGEQALHWSRSACSDKGRNAPQMLATLEMLLAQFAGEDRERLASALEMARSSGKPFDLELQQREGSSDRRWLRCIGHAQWQDEGWEVIGALQDITERKKFSEVVEQQATRDLLTGLPNRSAFYESLRWALADARRNHYSVALLFIDLDKFKPVNDSFGHAVGDELLRQVARRLQACLREVDTLSRISGDEFTVILRGLTEESAPIDVAERLLASIRQPFDLDGIQVHCGASIGIAVYPDDGSQLDELLSKADYAMYEVKKSGRNGCQYFTRSMQERSEQRHSLYTRLQVAIANRRLSIEYQPIIDLRSGRPARCEALVRWYDEEGRPVPTDEFIALAEETSLVNEIDYFVLDQASREIEALSQRLGWRIGLSVNLSPRLFISSEQALRQWTQLACEATGRVDLTVEITERVLIDGPDHAQRVLEGLKACGATIAIDDFGSGYSSLSYLTRLPIDYLKIDCSFVREMLENRPAQMLVDTIISLGKNLDLELVAEGVETPEQLAVLKQKQCEHVQGYLMARPMGIEQLEQWLR